MIKFENIVIIKAMQHMTRDRKQTPLTHIAIHIGLLDYHHLSTNYLSPIIHDFMAFVLCSNQMRLEPKNPHIRSIILAESKEDKCICVQNNRYEHESLMVYNLF